MKRAIYDPEQHLIREASTAARQSDQTQARAIAKREATLIPRTWHERHHTQKGDMTACARRLMIHLGDSTDEGEIGQIAKTLGECAAALREWKQHEVVETRLDKPKRIEHRAHA